MALSDCRGGQRRPARVEIAGNGSSLPDQAALREASRGAKWAQRANCGKREMTAMTLHPRAPKLTQGIVLYVPFVPMYANRNCFRAACCVCLHGMQWTLSGSCGLTFPRSRCMSASFLVVAADDRPVIPI